jgi:hypothetical protein
MLEGMAKNVGLSVPLPSPTSSKVSSAGDLKFFRSACLSAKTSASGSYLYLNSPPEYVRRLVETPNRTPYPSTPGKLFPINYQYEASIFARLIVLYIPTKLPETIPPTIELLQSSFSLRFDVTSLTNENVVPVNAMFSISPYSTM